MNWDELFCFLIETTGLTWSVLMEDWDLPRYQAWIRYCNACPPVRAMVQGYLGVKGVKVNEADDAEALLSVLSLFPGAVAI